jgi:hypothetical protein
MYDESWFQAGSQPVTATPSFMNLDNNKGDKDRKSVFLQSPSHHNYTTDTGVTILNADTQELSYSRQVFPLPLSAKKSDNAPHSTGKNRISDPENPSAPGTSKKSKTNRRSNSPPVDSRP